MGDYFIIFVYGLVASADNSIQFYSSILYKSCNRTTLVQARVIHINTTNPNLYRGDLGSSPFTAPQPVLVAKRLRKGNALAIQRRSSYLIK